MKKVIRFFTIAILFLCFFSCKKNNTAATKTSLLTTKTWIYDEYFTNYNQATTTLSYKRGKANNSRNMSANKVKFNSDGTYQETTETGQQLSGTWKFLDNETQTEVKNVAGTFTSNIVLLTDNSYIWYDQTSGSYGKMVPNN